MTQRIAHHRKLVVTGVVAALAVGVWLAIGFFGIHTLFFDDEVNEDIPTFASGAGASGLPSDATTEAEADAVNTEVEAEGTPTEDSVEETMLEVPEIVIEAAGMFVDRSHPAEGLAEALGDGTSQRFLRFEDFATDNGPDLNVYLSTAPPDAPAGEFDDDFVDLGDLKGNIGPQNYEIPFDVDLERYSTVVIWCVRFGVAFGAAGLTSF